MEPLVHGGGQEGGRRSGTENLPHIVGLARACQLATDMLPSFTVEVRQLRDRLHTQLRELLPGRVHLNGSADLRLPNTLNIRVDGVTAEDVLARADTLAAATGSACHEDTMAPSPVLLAMGQSAREASGAVRLSLGRWTSRSDIDSAAMAIASAATQADGSRYGVVPARHLARREGA